MPLVYWTMAPGAGQAARQPGVGAVHALVLAHQPVQRAVLLVLAEPDQVPDVRRHVGQRLVGPHLHGGFRRQIVPLLAGHLAGLAADARRGVDELGDRRHDADARRGRRRRRDAQELESRVGIIQFVAGPTPHLCLAPSALGVVCGNDPLSAALRPRLTPFPASRETPCTPAQTSWDRRSSASRGSPASRAAGRVRGSPSGSGTRSGTSSSRQSASA